MFTLIFLIMLAILGIKLVSRAFRLFDRWLDVEEDRMFEKKHAKHRKSKLDLDEFDV